MVFYFLIDKIEHDVLIYLINRGKLFYLGHRMAGSLINSVHFGQK